MSKSASLRRIKADIRELSIDPSDQYYAAPLENDMFEWHFTIRGAADTDFAGGVYHGRILLPPEYPFKPPNIVFLTPSGRFECGVKVCLSFSAHHPELWQPAWGIRLILEAIISFLPTPADGALGAIDWTPAERKKLAKESVKFRCLTCCAKGETCADLIPKIKSREVDGATGAASEEDGGVKRPTSKFHEECEKLKLLQYQNHALVEGKSLDDTEIVTTESKSSDADVVKKTDVQPTQLIASESVRVSQTSSLEAPHEVEASDSTALPTENIDEKPKQDDKVTQLHEQTPATAPATTTIISTAATATSPAPPADTATINIHHVNSLISDGVLHGMIGLFAIIVIFLLRQTQTLMDELLDLEEEEL
jgi:ubiquitin-conjugating enzyme E2 J1